MINKTIRKIKAIWRPKLSRVVESKESRLARELDIPLETIKMAQEIQNIDPIYWSLNTLDITKKELDFLYAYRKASEVEKINLIFGKSVPSFLHFIAGMKKIYISNKNAQRNSWKWLESKEHRRNACKMLADEPTPEQLLQAAVFCYYSMFTNTNKKKDPIAKNDLERIQTTWKTWQPKSIYSSTSKQQETEKIPTTMLSKSGQSSDKTTNL